MTEIEPWFCPTCRRTVVTPYCASCGEHPLRARELTWRGLVDQFVLAFTSIDGRLVRSVRCLVGRQGFLTLAYVEGRRKPYVGPVSLFVSANVLFFALESLTGGQVFSTPLDAHLHTQPWSGVAASLVTPRLSATRNTLELYAPVFNHAVALNARLLIVFMALSFTPVLLLVFRRSGRPLAAHVLFSLHLYAFLLLLFSVATIVPPIDRLLGGAGFASPWLDDVISTTLLAFCASYLYRATGAVYGACGSVRVFKVFALTAGVVAVVLGYRFALLLITLYST